MPFILAIEPDRKQASKVAALARNTLQVETIVVDSAAHALEILNQRTPDLILMSMLLSPREDAVLTDRLRELDLAGTHIQTLTIPVLGGPPRGSRRHDSSGLFSRLRRPSTSVTAHGCDPAVFAAQINEYLQRAASERMAAAEIAEPLYPGYGTAGAPGAPPAPEPPTALVRTARPRLSLIEREVDGEPPMPVTPPKRKRIRAHEPADEPAIPYLPDEPEAPAGTMALDGIAEPDLLLREPAAADPLTETKPEGEASLRANDLLAQPPDSGGGHHGPVDGPLPHEPWLSGFPSGLQEPEAIHGEARAGRGATASEGDEIEPIEPIVIARQPDTEPEPVVETFESILLPRSEARPAAVEEGPKVESLAAPLLADTSHRAADADVRESTASHLGEHGPVPIGPIVAGREPDREPPTAGESFESVLLPKADAEPIIVDTEPVFYAVQPTVYRRVTDEAADADEPLVLASEPLDLASFVEELETYEPAGADEDIPVVEISVDPSDQALAELAAALDPADSRAIDEEKHEPPRPRKRRATADSHARERARPSTEGIDQPAAIAPPAQAGPEAHAAAEGEDRDRRPAVAEDATASAPTTVEGAAAVGEAPAEVADQGAAGSLLIEQASEETVLTALASTDAVMVEDVPLQAVEAGDGQEIAPSSPVVDITPEPPPETLVVLTPALAFDLEIPAVDVGASLKPSLPPSRESSSGVVGLSTPALGDTAPAPEPAATAQLEMLEMLSAIRRDLEHLRAERVVVPSQQVEPAEPPVETADAADMASQGTRQVDTRHDRPDSTRDRKKSGKQANEKTRGSRPNARGKKKKGAPLQDEWGFFDPDQCGFAALLEKLEEITEEDNPPQGAD